MYNLFIPIIYPKLFSIIPGHKFMDIYNNNNIFIIYFIIIIIIIIIR